MQEPLLWPALAALAGVIGGRALSLTLTEALVAAALFLALTMLGRWRGLPRWWIPALAFVGAIGALLEVTARPGPPPHIESGADEVLSVSACVVEPSSFFEGRMQFTVELEPGARAKVYQYPKNGLPPRPVIFGEVVQFDARIRRPGSFENPGGFDYPAYLARQHIYWTATLPSAAEVQHQPGQCGGWVGRALAQARATLLARIDGFFPRDDYASGMLQALLLGETSQVKKLWTEDFRRTGTFHALVISGQHVVVLTAGWVWVIFQLTRRRWLAGLAGVLLAWIYTGLAGGAAPVLRAAWGLTFYAGARFFYRDGRVLNILAAVVLVFLVLDPGQAYDASFQLSFLAVLAIGALSSPLAERTTAPFLQAARQLANAGWDVSLPPRVAAIRVELRLLAETLFFVFNLPMRWALPFVGRVTWLCATVAEMLLITATVQLVLALPLVAYFHRFPVTGLLANLLVAPLLSLAIPAGMLAVVSNWGWLAQLAAWLVHVSGAMVEWSAKLEPAWRIPSPPAWLALSLILSLALLAVALRLNRWRAPAWALAAAASALLLVHPFAPDIRRGELELTAIDIGQGDGLLMVLPDGRTLAIDAGGLNNTFRQAGRRTSGINTGEDVIAPYLWTRSIRRLDVLVLTHAHADHMGGLTALIENFQPGEIWTGLMPTANADWQAVVDAARRQGTRIKSLREGDEFRAGQVQFNILAPLAGREPTPEARNDDSLAMLVTYGRRRLLLTGDLEAPVERRLLAEWDLPAIDVLKVGHHGSRTSTSEAWLDRLKPGVALVSVGRGNRYHHPHPRVTERLAERGIVTLRTDLLGLVTVRTNGHWLDFDSYRWQRASDALLPPFGE
ncbi:MAG: DNA internalization-related competence protein ComEC/Rec2 [Bryobacteraceae bacterium]|nr:DNA internalization-related competence protein ComEC/Rec2 [Bryobacteraceae bacterium]